MSENEDLKQETTTMTLRVSPEHSKRFKELSKELSTNHAELFSNLISAFELDQAKSILPQRQKEIEAFQTTAKTLVSMFMHSLEVNQSIEEKIRTEFRAELDASTHTINNLHEQLKLKKEEWDTEKLRYEEQCKDYEFLMSQMTDKQKQLQLCESQLEDKAKELQDKDKRVVSLEKMLENQQQEIDTLKASLSDLPKMQMELQELSNENFKYSVQVESLEQKLDLANEALKRREAEFEHIENLYKATIQQKSDDYQEKIQEIKELKQSLRRLEREFENSEQTIAEFQSREAPVKAMNMGFPVNEDKWTTFGSESIEEGQVESIKIDSQLGVDMIIHEEDDDFEME